MENVMAWNKALRGIQEKPEDQFEVIDVTPEMATRFLASMTKNRPLVRRNIDYLAQQMEGGFFQFNGEPLIFDEQGRMLDGQHRCEASKRSGLTFRTLVVRNVPADRFDTMGTGAKRSAGAVLAIEGISHYNLVAGALRHLIFWERTGLIGASNGHFSPYEIRDAFSMYPEVETIASHVNRACSKLRVKPSLMTAVCWVIVAKSKIGNMEAMEDFLHAIAHGEGVNTDPAKALHNWFVANALARKKARDVDFVARVINGWNAHVRGKTIHLLTGQRKGAQPDIA